MKKIRIAVVDDHRLFRESLARFLRSESEFEVTLLAANGSELLNELKQDKVDVVLLDLSMPILSGWQTLPILNERYPKIRVILLSMYESDAHIVEGIKLGARSFMCKDCETDALIDAIHTVYKEGFYFDKSTSRALRNRVADRHFEEIRMTREALTERETQIVQLICAGKSNKEISDLLFISVRTVEAHRKAIFAKTDCKTVATLAIYAVKHGIYQIV
jgi:DNA-binding NarL/FixJ family response regulator